MALDPNDLPSFVQPDVKPAQKRGLISAGLKSGLDEAASLEGSVIQLGGDLVGSKSVSDFGARAAAASSAASQQDGRPDLEIAPWHQGGASVLPWLAYQTLKQVPQLATYVAAGAALPEAAVPASLSRLGAIAPRVLGGGGLEAGASFAARKAALEAGTDFGKSVIGAEAAGIPFAAGSMYQEATSKPGGAAPGDAALSLVASPFYAALDALEPAQFKGLMTRGLAGNVLKRVATAGLVGAAMEVPQEGVQTAMEQSFRTDLTPRQKLTNIVDAAVTGGAVGAAIGGAGGIRALKSADAHAVTNEDLSGTIDSVLSLPAPPVTVDTTGRAAYGSNGPEDLKATPRDVGMSASERAVASYNPEMQPQIESQTIIQPKEGSLRWAKPLETQEQRPLGTVAQPELEMAARVAGNYLGALPEGQPLNERDQKIADHYQLVADELNYRGVNNTATNDNVASSPAGAVEQSSDVSGGAAANSSVAPAPVNTNQNWAQQRDELLKGVGTRKSYLDLGSLDEAKATLIARLEGGSTAKGDLLLAERLGVNLNEPTKVAAAEAGDQGQASAATSVANDQTATTVPAAPANVEGGDQSVDTGFQKEWSGLLSKHRGDAIQALRENPAPNREAAMRQVYDALGASSNEDVRTDGYKGLTALAQTLGIHNEQGLLTDKGVQVARAALPLEATVAAAKEAGYAGTEASAFDNGARGQQNVTLGSITELKAYNDGRDWATNRDAKNSPIPNTATEADTAKIVDKTTAKQDALGQTTRQAVTSTGIPDKQRGQQFLNQAIDQIYGSTLKPGEQAQLKQMVKKGATGEQLDAAAKKMQGGETVLANPAPAAKPFKGETIERGPLIQARERAAAAVAASQDQLLQQRIQSGNKAEMTQARNEHERYKSQLRDALNEAADTGEITRKELISHTANLIRGNFKAIEDRLSNRQRADRRQFLAGAAAVAVANIPVSTSAGTRIALATGVLKPTTHAALQPQLQAGNIKGALNVIKSGSKNPTYRLIAAKLLRGNWEHVQLNTVPKNSDWMGLTTLQDNGDSLVELGADGMNEETTLHELIHAYVQQVWGGVGLYTEHNKTLLKDSKNRGDAEMGNFLHLWDHMADVMKRLNPQIATGENAAVWQQQMWADPDEMLSWVLTNKDAQTWLKSVDIEGNAITTQPSLWQRFMEFIASALGLPYNTKTESALDHIMSAGFSVLDKGAGQDHEFSKKIAGGIAQQRDAHAAGMQQALHTMVLGHSNDIIHDVSVGPALAGIQNAQVKERVDKVISVVDAKINTDGARGVARRAALYMAAEGPIAEHWGKQFDTKLDDGTPVNGVQERVDVMGRQHALASHMAQQVTNVNDQINKLARTDKAAHKAIMLLMQLSEHGLHPFRPWAQQSELVRTSKNAANLQALHTNVQPLVRSLLAKGTSQLYFDMQKLNDVNILSERATRLHQLVKLDKFAAGLPEFAVAPTDKYLDHVAAATMDLNATHKFWGDEVRTQLTAIEAHVQSQRIATDTMALADKKDLLLRASQLEKMAGEVRGLLKQLEATPYFHLGRSGRFFVNMQLRTLQDGSVDPTALTAAAEHLAEFGKVISSESSQSNIYIRVDNEVAQKNLLTKAEELQKKGVVTTDTKDAKTGKVSAAIKSGQRDDTRIRNSLAGPWLDNYISRINGDETINADDKQRMIEVARSAALDVMPDNSLALVMSQRKSVPGFDPDMYQSFFDRQKVGIDAHVGLSAAPKIAAAFGHMRLATERAQDSSLGEVPIARRNGMTDIINELSKRDTQRANQPRTPVIDMIRRASNTMALGLSPAFVVVQFAQPLMITLPKLGARHGFIKSAQAMARVTPMAFKIMRQVFKDGLDVSVARSFDAVISLKSLQGAGVPRGTAEYIMHVANTGALDIGGPVHELSLAVDGGQEDALSKVQRLASAPGYYAETFTRLLGALSHRELNSGGTNRDAAQEASTLLKATMWDYAQDQQGRMFTKSGPLGTLTPLSTQFMTYTSQLVQRLYLELYEATRGETPQSRSEARRFLAGHLAMTTAFAGTLGLPMATAFAAAFDRLKDAWDDDNAEPSNVRADYRNWLAGIFGKDIAEGIARGPSRAIGVDLSTRLGEQDITPFSKFIADRRSLKDSLKDLEARTWGAPVSQASGLIQGMSDISDGNVMDGLTKVLPNSMAAVVKAYKLTDEGYVDAQGKPLPMSAGTRDVLVQLVGFNPAPKAEYNEARQDSVMRKGEIVRQASTLRDQLAQALTSGDDDSARKLVEQVHQFDSANPAFAVMPGMRATLARRSKDAATAQALRAPLGVNPKDIKGQQLTDYANY